MVRRVLALACVGLAVVVCVTLAASESLRNRTGSTATAVTVTFSEKVTISGYNTAVFTTQEPKAKASTFRFSGGQLEDGGRFMISWLPSSAEIVDTQWEVPAAAKTGPLTYEEIMAQIAHYPGPDEPLYVPAEGEQIWLTDLEGHADIYDNDSIKINYAPGFDKSQITKIEVYRNDVKMRFLPALFDVLTNEQMKTFDGNSAEKTPKSQHTDHAIFGYRYEVRVHSGTQLIAPADSVRIRSPFKYVFESPYAYLGSGWESSMYGQSWDNKHWMSDAEVIVLLTKLKEWGFKGVSINVNCFVSDPYSSTVFRQPSLDARVSDWQFTASDEQLSRLLDLVTRTGLQASVRMQLYIAKEWTDHTWGYGATIQPRSVDDFFSSYSELACHLAQLGGVHGAVMFNPFTEMDSIGRETQRVKRFYDQLAVVFDGEFGFEESTNHYLEGWGFSLRGELSAPFRELAGQFWDWVDPSGRPMVIEWSCWTPPLETQNDQRLSVLLEDMQSFWKPALDYYRAVHPRNKIRFGEAGTYNVDGIGRGGEYANTLLEAAAAAGSDRPGVRDVQEVADIWAAYIISSMAMELQGLTVWLLELTWDFHLAYDHGIYSMGENNAGFSPALAVISSLLGGEWNR